MLCKTFGHYGAHSCALRSQSCVRIRHVYRREHDFPFVRDMGDGAGRSAARLFRPDVLAVKVLGGRDSHMGIDRPRYIRVPNLSGYQYVDNSGYR